MRKICLICTQCALFVLIILLLSFPIAAQQSANEDAPSPPGKLVDAGGHLLHINCIGKGSPVVVMESGAGDFSLDWGLAQPAVARYARVCAYDRAGYGWSEPGPAPRTMQQIAFELHTALRNAKIKGPYILVGQSLGGLIVRTYASRYPREVAGIVLVDSSHEDTLLSLTDMKTRQEKIVRFRELSRGREIPPVQAAMLTTRATFENQPAQPPSSSQSKLEAPYDKLPPSLQRMRLWAMSQPSYNPARSGEFDYLPEEMSRIFSERSKNEHPLGDIPLIVLTRAIRQHTGTDNEVRKQLDESHSRLQANLVTLSTNSKQMIAKNSGHHIQLDDPELVADAIGQVINAFQKHKRLIKQ